MASRTIADMWRAGLSACIMALSLAGCGGGSDGDGDSNASPSASTVAQARVTATPTAIEASTVAGTDGAARLDIQISVSPDRDYWLTAEDTRNIVVDAVITDDQQGSHLALQLDGQLPAGAHDSQIQIRVCADEACTRPLAGGSLTVPVHFVVKPNITASASTVSLARQGAEAAPAQTLTLDVPAEAGATELHVQTDQPDAFDIQRQGNTLVVGTRQVRAGHYSATVTMGSPGDPRYQWRLPVDYTVHPPAGGEHDLIIHTGSPLDFPGLIQGQKQQQIVTISRATWTSDFVPPILLGPGKVFSLRDLGGDRYEITADATNLSAAEAGQRYSTALRFGATRTTAEQDLLVGADVMPNWGLRNGFEVTGISLGNASTVANTNWQRQVNFMSLLPAIQTWRASTTTPWLRLAQTSGRIGLDALSYTIVHDDLSWIPGPGQSVEGLIEVRADGSNDTLTLRVPVSNDVGQLLAQIGAPAVATVLPRANRVYIQARGVNVDPRFLQVQGAAVMNAATTEEQWLLGADTYLALDLGDVSTVDQVTVRWNTAFSPSSVTVPVLQPQGLLARFASLSNSPHRAISLHPANGSAVAADEGQVVRLSPRNGAATRTTAAIPGLIDATYSADGSRVFAITADELITLDGSTLTVLGRAALPAGSAGAARPDGQSPRGSAALLTAADGHVFMAARGVADGDMSRGVAWLTDQAPGRVLSENSVPPRALTLGSPLLGQVADRGMRLQRSPGGQIVMAQYPDGRLIRYTDLARRWTSVDGGDAWGSLPEGVSVAALADVDDRFIRSDGVLQVGRTPAGFSLASLVPEGDLVGGYGLSPDGSTAYIYHYRVDTSGSRPRQTGALLRVVDINMRPLPEPGSVGVVGDIPISGPLGCSGTVAAENCVHQVSLTIDPTGELFYAVGPRGMSAAGIGDMMTLNAAAGRARAQSLRPALRWRATRAIPASGPSR